MRKLLKQQGYMLPNRPCLVIAESGRALAASAARAHIKTHVIDRFADIDTRKYALTTRRVSANHKGFCAQELKDALDDYAHIPLTGVVVGSGLESQPELLDIINANFSLLGNQSECVRTCKHPILFFSLLESLHIPFPPFQLKTTGDSRGWLIKRIGGAGGQHIGYVTHAVELSTDQYFQEFIKGRSLSLTFIANGKQAQVFGVNETWTRDPENYDFCYAGAITLPEIDNPVITKLREISNLLVKHLGLVGLCGIDVIVDSDGECYVLEVNPRPTATFELYERGNSLFYAHLLACEGRLVPLQQQYIKSCGHEIIFAPVDLHIAETGWPGWVVNRPCSDVQIATGEPICTIRAAANSPDEVRKILEQRKASLYKMLGLQRIAA
jgi:uncharacterized protein